MRGLSCSRSMMSRWPFRVGKGQNMDQSVDFRRELTLDFHREVTRVDE